jgi:hypothetical protein
MLFGKRHPMPNDGEDIEQRDWLDDDCVLPFLVWVQRILKAVRLKDDLHVAQAVFRRWARFPGLCSSLRGQANNGGQP